MLKKLISLLLMLFMLTSIVPNSIFADSYFYDGKWNTHNEDIKLYFNDKNIKTDVPALIVESRTLVPVRAFFEEAGATVLWNDGKKEVTVKTDKFTVKLKIDSTNAYVNSEQTSMDVPAKIVADADNIGRTLVPVRFISEKLGYKVKWDEKTYSVYVSDDKNEPVVEKEQIKSISTTKSGSTDTIKLAFDGSRASFKNVSFASEGK